MAKPIIEVRNIGKKYKLGATHEGTRVQYRSLRDLITSAASRIVNKSNERQTSAASAYPRLRQKEFWALRSISFVTQPGEVLGIIGSNGAGKTTLLKVLSQITEPTEGEIHIKGRVASLLEVGTGFHPELTGRENIFMNGSILGMRRNEIRAKFDEIVSFAEVEEFIDTPIKRYSSGMTVRLAFAVAAHLEPEILLVDEVLAVGDVGFQKKCIAKMENVAGEGRTVVLVSHNMGIVGSLCQRTLLIVKGKIVKDGDTSDVISVYTNHKSDSIESEIDLQHHEGRLPGMKPLLQKIRVCDEKGSPTLNFMQGEKIVLEVEYDSGSFVQSLAGAGFILYSMMGVRVGGFNTYMGAPPPHSLPSRGIVKFIIKNPVLTPGGYYITISVGTHQNHLIDKIENAINFMMLCSDIYKTGYLLTAEDGVVALECSSSVVELNS
jgi:lipopolysaccharide transport system ATP-binding protein